MQRTLGLLTGIMLLGLAPGWAFAGESLETPLPRDAMDAIRSRVAGGIVTDTYLPSTPVCELRLSRADLLWGSERVFQEARLLRPDTDYQVDRDTGRLRLSRRAPAGTLLQVSYRTSPFDSSAASVTLPLRRLAASRHVVGLSGARDRLEAILERRSGSLLSVSPRLAFGGGMPGQAETLKEELESGLRATQLSETEDENGQRGAFTYFRADPLDPRTADEAREEFSSEVSLHPSPASKLLITNYFSKSGMFSEFYQQSERRRIQLEQTWGKSTTQLLWEHRRTDGDGVADSLDALSLTTTAHLYRGTTADAFFSHQDSQLLGRDTRGIFGLRQVLGNVLEGQANVGYQVSSLFGNGLATSASLDARPTRGSDFKVDYQGQDSDRYGRSDALSGDARVLLGDRVQVMSQVSERSAPQLGNVFTYGLGFSAQPNARSLLEAAFSESTGQKIGQQETETFRLSLDPASAIKLQLGYDLLYGSRTGSTQNAIWMVTVGGARYVRLEGYSGLSVPLDHNAFNDSLYRVEVRPVPAFAVSGSLRQVELDRELRTLAGLGASVKLLRGVEVNATYRQPYLADGSTPDLFGRDVQLNLAPIPTFRLFGQYSVNPEDDRGGLLDQTNKTVGVESRFGSFSLQGSLTRMDGLLAAQPGTQMDFLASLALGHSTKLYGGYRTLEGATPDQPKSQLYRVGISQAAGQAFFMTLEGQFGWLIDGTGARSWNLDDTRAQARVGLRF